MTTLICLMEAEASSLSLNISLLNNSTLTSSNSLNSTCLSGNETFRCPAWAYYSETAGICKCYKPSEALFCDPKGIVNRIFSCYCLTYNEAEDVAELGPCIYNCDYVRPNEYEFHNNLSFREIPNNTQALNSDMCKDFHRTGTLCGECLNDTFIRVYSYDMSCSKCDGGLYNWLKYIAVAFLPLTLFCLVVIACQINIPSSQLLGYVFFCQTVTSPVFARTVALYINKKSDHSFIKLFIQVIETLYGIWNLDFFRFLDLNICLKTSSLTTLSLNFFIATYPLVIIIFIYILTLMHDSNWKIVVAMATPLKTMFSKLNSPSF